MTARLAELAALLVGLPDTTARTERLHQEEDVLVVDAHLFKPSGKWAYTTPAIYLKGEMAGEWDVAMMAQQAVRRAADLGAAQLSRGALDSSYTLVITDHPESYPVMTPSAPE
ncbi:hypothetical protein GO986_17445 [Deinococcus sp. HMF7620]|uniref:Uncharacterized protein n=1 Tax=Deinococcus arboris TaxID=2682977 RepID=A0A7C9IDS2_9DEIO|nr:hypothetical protein [Deinococcus arboris]MVN88526.1 hypothetical protein [Deinococcus arboris]